MEDLVKMTQDTAQNLYNLLMQLANHMQLLQEENTKLKEMLNEDE